MGRCPQRTDEGRNAPFPQRAILRCDRREPRVDGLFEYGSTNFQYVYALGDQIQLAIKEAKVGEYDGHALPADGSEGRYFLNGPDAEAIFQAIAPVLEASP